MSFTFVSNQTPIMRFLSLLTIVLLASTSFSQTTLRGNITDADGTTLPGVHVYFEDSSYGTYSGLDGDYALLNAQAGAYKLVVSYIGYEDQVIDVTLEADKVQYLDVVMNDGLQLTEIIINGRLLGQAKALSERKNRGNISEIVDAEQIERFPDANIGDALKRLSGINVQYDQGEARFANIRGVAPELSSITINGERIPSAEAEQRFVQLDLVPADMIQTIELNKAVTPDLDGDAIGGSVNLVTQKAKSGHMIKGKLGSGYSILTAKPLYKGQLSYSNRFANDRLGFIGNISILDKYIRSDNVEAEWDRLDDGTVYTNEQQIRQYQLQRLRQSYSAILDYDIAKGHNIFVSGMYTKREDWENRYRLRYNDIEQDDDGNWVTEIRKQTKGGPSGNKFGRLEDQRMYSLRVGGDHLIGNMEVNWAYVNMYASEDRPNERYISMRNKDVVINNLNLSNPRTPMVEITDGAQADLSSITSLREVTEEFQFTEESDNIGRVDFNLPVMFGKNSSNLKFGGKYKSKSKIRNNSFREFEPVDEDGFVSTALSNTKDITEDNFSAGNYTAGLFVNEEFLGGLELEGPDFEGEDVNEESAGNFNASEDVTAAYSMYTQSLGSTFDFIAGARFEQTSVNYSGTSYDTEADELSSTPNQSEDYSNFLPGLHLNYRPKNNFNVRAAWTNTLARPNYFDLVPYEEINTEDNEIALGNPALEATTSMNLDLMAELFFDNIGVISGGVFYKDLTNVIATATKEDVEYKGNVYDDLEQPLNIGNATLIGFEFGLSKRLDFLPGPLGNLSFYGNYTYNKSEVTDIVLEDRENEVLPLVGTPKSVTNLSLAYDTKKLDFRVSYNLASSFIEEYGDEAFYDRWYDSVNYLDINADYELNDKWKIYMSLNNLLNQPLRFYQGEVNRTMQVEYYGPQIKAGLKFKFK